MFTILLELLSTSTRKNNPFQSLNDVKSEVLTMPPGAGRPVKLAKRLHKGCSPEAIAEAVATVDVGGIIIGLLKSKREKTRIETLVFVWDRLYGRPAQNVQVSGGVLHAHAWRPMASLSDEEVALLDKLTRKLSQPVLDASPDAPQNQIESKPAIEAEALESKA